MSNKTLSLNDILAVADVETRRVDVPEWGGTVVIKGLTKRDQQRLRKQASAAAGTFDADVMEHLILSQCLAEPVVTPEQAAQLLEKSAAAVDRVLTAIMDITGLSEAAQRSMSRTFHPGDERPEE